MQAFKSPLTKFEQVAKRYTSPIIVYLTKKNHKAYINLKKQSFDWNPPETLECSPYLTLAEVEVLSYCQLDNANFNFLNFFFRN